MQAAARQSGEDALGVSESLHASVDGSNDGSDRDDDIGDGDGDAIEDDADRPILSRTAHWWTY